MKNVEDIYPLSPMQEVMLLHAQAVTRGDVLFNQFCYEITGALNVGAFRSAWQLVIDRHPVLRSCFVWEDLKQPLQIVRQRASVSFETLDWRDRPAEEQQAAIADLKRDDRAQPFDPRKAPLLRFTLVSLGSDLHFFLWSSHHLLLDRWCLGTLYRDLSAAYTSACRGLPAELPHVRPFRDYLNWIQRQDPVQSEQFWRSLLSGFTSPTPLTRAIGKRPSTGDSAFTSSRQALPTELSQALRDLARANGITVSILVQAALALSLGQQTGRADVVFGSVVSGRPVDLPDVEAIVGTFVNNVPVRVLIPTDAALLDWLKHLQVAQAGRARHEYVSPVDIQLWSDLTDGAPLFDTLLVWLSAGEPLVVDDLNVEGLAGQTTTAYPLTLSVLDDAQGLTLCLDLRSGHVLIDAGFDLLGNLEALLGKMVGLEPATRIGDLGINGLGVAPAVGDAALAHGYRSGRGRRSPSADISPAGREPLTDEALTEMLRSEWGLLLSTEPKGIDDDFFAIGGTSLLAASLHARVEINLHQSIPLMTLFREPTIRKMVETLLARDWPLKPETVIPVRPRGSRPPLFCVSSPDVNTLGYAQLARHLTDEQPVYVLQSPPDSNLVRRLDPGEIPQVAATYIEAMREVQPTGPYALLGMCTGAQLAFEMAKQLVKTDNQVAFVGIVDTYAYYTISRLFYLKRLYNRYHYLRARLADLLQRPAREQVAMLAGVARRRLSSLRAEKVPAPVGASGAAKKPALPAAESVHEQALVSPDGDPWIDGMGWVRKRGQIEKFDGLLTVYRRRRQKYWRIREFSLGWSYFADRIRVEALSAEKHPFILREPHVREFAARLGAHLHRARADCETGQR